MPDSMNEAIYTEITSEWMTMQHNNELGYPQLE
jgi:hypothetical protein